jgi:endonuclease G
MAVLLLCGGTAKAACPQHFAYGHMPGYRVAGYQDQSQLVCQDGFALLYSGKSRTALWVGEYLTPQRIAMARTIVRDSEFHEESMVPAAWRAHLADYVHSGYDRGHLAPSGDMPTEQAQHQSFSLANIVPQDPRNNRGVWAGVEQAVRNYAAQTPVYVVTGVVFSGQNIGFLKGRVAVPTHLYKLVYDPARRSGAVYIVGNNAQATVSQISIAQLSTYTALDYGLGQVAFMALPAGDSGYHGRSR